MSYFEIRDKLNIVGNHLNSGRDLLNSICNFLKAFNSLTDNYTSQLSKLVENLNIKTKGQNMDTLSTGISSFIELFLNLIPVYSEYTKNIQEDLIEPLDLFAQHYAKGNQIFLSRGKLLDEHLSKARKVLELSKTKYFKACEAANPRVIDKAQKDYISALNSLNLVYNTRDQVAPEVMGFLQQSEESRINFIKTSLEKYLSHFYKWTASLSKSAGRFSKTICNINSGLDITIFVDVNKSSLLVTREEFVSYDEWKRTQSPRIEDTTSKVIDYLCTPELNETSQNSVLSEPSSEELEKVSESLKEEELRILFIDILDSKPQPISTDSTRMNQLAGLAKQLLHYANPQQTNDHYCICRLLIICSKIKTEDKRTLTEFIKDHPVWQDKEFWTAIIDKSIQCRLETERKAAKKYGNFKRFLNSIVNIASEVFQKFDERVSRGVTSHVTSQYILLMSQMQIPSHLATEIVLEVANKCSLDLERACNLIAEVKISLNSSISGRKTQQKVPHPIKLCLKFLEIKDILSVLSVCKLWNEQFMLNAKEICLLRAENKDALRKKIWTDLLMEKSPRADYSKMLESDYSCISDLIGVIAMDSARSFRDHPLISVEILKRILRGVAIYNTEVGYCQGMNYIAGTLYNQLRDEALTFNCILGMFEKYEMKEMFVQSLPKLRQFFYQFDRLIGIMLPEIALTFRDVGLTSGHFASSWFITIFASSFQDRPHLILQIWDLFIVKGWKIIFRIALVILKNLTQEIVHGNFDDIMLAISDSTLLHFSIDEVKLFKVTNCLLKELEEEYKSFKFLYNDENTLN